MRFKHSQTIVIALLLFFLSTFSLSAQTPKIDLELDKVSLNEFFNKIEAKTGYTVMYNNVDLTKPVSVKAKNESLDAVLKKALSSQNISFEIIDKRIILNPKSLATTQGAKKRIEGTITDELGDPIIGASVTVKGSTIGMMTDVDGHYSLEAPEGSSIEVTFIGYHAKTEKVGAQSIFNFVLKENTKMLNEVVVVGYGTMEKRQVTSSISSIKGDALPKGMGGATIATALKGQISGLTISGNSSPNASNEIQLRGVASVNAGKGPLVVVDGIPGGDLRSLNQEDIESIDVLKDASAGAIYGTRAAGGVILVTTKQAKEGPVKITYTGEFTLGGFYKLVL